MNKAGGSKNRTGEIHNMIAREFPSCSYDGTVTRIYDKPPVYEAKTDDLNTILRGKSWRDLYPDFVDANEDEYLLMNGAALSAFLGAWLWRASEDLNTPNQIRSTLIFHLATFGAELWAGGFKELSQRQRKVIRVLLESAVEFASVEETALIEKALRNMDTGIQQR